MTETLLLRDLGIILVAGAALALLGRGVRVPAIVAYIAAGLLLGPVTGLIEVTPSLHRISETGVALLLFLVGLELSLDRVRDVGPVALKAGFLQVALTWVGGSGLALALGLEPVPAAVVGLAVTLSSTAVVVKLLDETGELRDRHGRISVGILLVQDLVVVVALTFLAGLAGGGSVGHTPGAGAGPPAGSPAGNLAGAFLGMAILAAGAALASRHLLPRLFAWVASDRETLFVWSLSWCFLLVLGAEAFHLSLELGAFLAGIAVAQLSMAHDLSRRVSPLTSFFLAVFFVSLGVGMDPAAAAGALPLVAGLSLFVLLGKGALLTWILARLGQDEETAFRTGVTLAQGSEFSFILVALAAAAGLVDPELAAAVALTALLTIAVSAYGIGASGRLYGRLRGGRLLGILGAAAPDPGPGEDVAPSGHIVVVGMNPLGRTLVRRLADAGEEVVAVDTDPRKLEDLPARTVHGGAQDPAVLAEAGLDRARLLVSALRIEDVNALLAHRCREAGVTSSIHAFDPSVVERLLETGADHLMVSWDEGTRKVAAHLASLGVLGSGAAAAGEGAP